MIKKHGRMSEEQAKSEFRQFHEARNVIGNKLIEEWKGCDVGSGLEEIAASNPAKARNTAIALTMEEAHLEQLSENIISTSFSMKPENVLKVIRIGVANSNRGDIFTEYALQTTDDAFYHIDMTYETDMSGVAAGSRGATAGDKIYENINPYYAGEQVRMQLEALCATNAQRTNIYPTGGASTGVGQNVVPYSVLVMSGGAIIGSDDGMGNLSFTGIDTGGTNTINYTTGAVSYKFLVAPNTKIEIMFNWNTEDANLYQYFGTVGIALSKTRFNARPHPLGYSYTTMTEIMLGTTGLGSAEDLLVGAVGDEHAKARDYKAIARGRALALINGTEYFDTDFAAAGEISDKSHAQKIMSKIKEIGGVIYDDIKRGQINKAVAGSKALVYLMKHDQWTDDTSQPRTGVYRAGKLGDIEVFACPADVNLVSNNEILLTYKNPQEGLDVSMVFGVLTEIAASLQYPEFYKVGNVASVEDAVTINSKFIRLLNLQNL